jgi:flagellar motor switch protein FliN
MKKLQSDALKKSPISMQCEVGRTVKKIHEILQFKKGTYIKLEKSTKNVIAIYANDVHYANGKAMRKDGELYVKVTDIVRKKEGGK